MKHGFYEMKRKSGGFTLVELLIVIMIIGILAGMTMLAVGAAQDNAEATRVINDLRALKSAMLVYYADNGVWLTGEDFGGAAGRPSSLDVYLGRPRDTNRYEGVVAGVAADSSANAAEMRGKVIVGLVMASNGSANKLGVWKKLEQRAEALGLYGGSPSATNRGFPEQRTSGSGTLTQRTIMMIVD